MRALTLQQANVAPGDQQQSATCWRSLSSNYAPLNLENKFLTQTSLMMPQPGSSLINFAAQSTSCPLLQPSSLSSTSSSLLSTSSLAVSLTSPLLSTQNKLLTSDSSHPSFSLTSSFPNTSLLSMSLPSGTLLNRFAQPPSFLPHGLDGEQKNVNGGDEDGEEISEVMPSCFEETSVCSEDGVWSEEEEVEADAGTAAQLPVMETELGNEDQAVAVLQEEFAEVERGIEQIEEDLKDLKYLLLNAVCCSLVNKSTAPGQGEWDKEDSVWTTIINLAKEISASDPQFLLKVAVYTRQELNIRITANFLLALAANLPLTKSHVRRYFCTAVQLPSDWLEVVRIYSTCFSHSLPMCLKKAMADKFKEFSEYQLAKYNTRKMRCKHACKKNKGKKPTDDQLKKWANMLRSDETILKKFLQIEDSKVRVDKKQSEFSIKKMIKRLHIKEPAEHVMAILGKKYPADQTAFTDSGIKGNWDRKRAGQRMKLKEPETWERLLSLEGNKAATWEKLIDNKSLPFMAMLRNLRNMIIMGISEAHHKKILGRLTDKKAVTQSRQFPFRFLAAYKVIMELHSLASESQQKMLSAKEILQGILKRMPKSHRFKRQHWETATRSRMRVTLGVPSIYRLYRMKKNQLLKANHRLYSVDLLDRYRKALETAVQISCRYNVPPLPGRTVILLNATMNTDASWSRKQDFCLPPEPEEKPSEEEEDKSGRRRRNYEEKLDKLTPSFMEVGALLALMIRSSAEDCLLCLTKYDYCEEAELKSDGLLENVRTVVKQMKSLCDSDDDGDTSYYYRTFTKKNKVDNVIILTDHWIQQSLVSEIRMYKNEINNKALVVNVYLSDGGHRDSENGSDRNWVRLAGFSDQMLRFVAERGSSRLLDHVEHLDKLYSIPPPVGAKEPETTNNLVSIPASPKLRWRGVRVFISSTFRDMHSERDVLVRSVFPELRRRAAQHRLHLQEVELRWGVTEEESERAAQLCLSEVCRSQMLVGILGERYGMAPPKPDLPDLPQYSWLASAPEGLSITEMEIRQFEALYPEVANQRMFCYFRDPNVIKSVPVAWRSHFAAESKNAESKMASLKKRLLDSDVKVTENYSCEWGGLVEGKPHLKKLEDFGKFVLEDLWMAVVNLFVEEGDEAKVASEMSEQEVHQEALRRQFFGRSQLLSGAVTIVDRVQKKGGMMVVEGGPGDGKTVFMAALADALRTEVKSKRNIAYDVISYSTAASQSARSVENLLQCLVQWLRKMKDSERESSPLPHSYKDLLSEFHSTLSDVKKDKPLALLVDGVDLVRDGRGQLNSDWIPQQLPQGVCLVMSITSKAALLQTLAKKTGTVLFTLTQLTMLDRREMVQKKLDASGKRLSDSAFNNQLQILTMKNGAASPLYLHLACEDLKNFASFDKLKENLQDLPQSLSQLVEYSLKRLCSQYRGMLGLRWALSVLAVSTTGLKEKDFYSLLNTCNDLSSLDGQNTWEEVLNLSRKPNGRTPMATFTRIVQTLQSLIGSSCCHDTDDFLVLTNPEVKRGFEEFLLPTDGDRTRAHLILAALLWTLADPQDSDTFFHCEADSVMNLPASLIQSGQLEVLHSLLSSYYFLYANVSHGLLHHLLETYSLFDKKNTTASSSDFQSHMEDCRGFLRRHASTLSSWPALFIQQAFNDPPDTSAHSWARGLVGRGVRVIECLNNNSRADKERSELVSTFSSEPTCLVVNLDEQLMVVGTGQGTLHFIHTETGQEVKSLVSSCDGISSCVFLKDKGLATTSFDGRIEVWDIKNGCRTALIEGHSNTITAIDINANKKYLATVSLDFTLKVWSTKVNEVASLPSTSPLNCVTFDPDGHLLAAGCWNGDVIVWKWLKDKSATSLCGHKRSVRSVSFSPSSSSMLCSGSVCGEVRVWSLPTSTCVGCFQAHLGATEALTFLKEESMLLSAGSDHTLQLWSGGLGCSVTTLKDDECEQEPPQKKLKSTRSESAAVCVAVNGDFAAVAYQHEGVKLFSLVTGEKVWNTTETSVQCLLWITLDPEKTEPELLLAGGEDSNLRAWKKKEGEEGMMGGLESVGMFTAQTGTILAMAQNTTYLATASDEFTIALCLLSDKAEDLASEPHATLRGHTGGVTCLAFSPDGEKLLSGGKDQALMVWDVASTPPALFKLLPHAHGDWITGCVWTPNCVISSSNDGKLCLWDLEVGQHLKEISWKRPLLSVCSLEQYVMAGCSDGALHVWNWDTEMEICHIAAHKKQINHCSLLPNTDEEKDAKAEDMTVFTASDDGTVQLWKPFQVEHFSTFQGHSGAVHGVVLKEEGEFLSVSEDRSLRCWTWTTESPRSLRGAITALCFHQHDDMVLAGYESGLMELWQNHKVICHKQLTNSPIAAVCSMPNSQFAVSYLKTLLVDVWKLVWSKQRDTVSLVKVSTHKVSQPVVRLIYCSTLLGITHNATIIEPLRPKEDDTWSCQGTNWTDRVIIRGISHNDDKSIWLVGEEDSKITIGFMFVMGPSTLNYSCFSSLVMEREEEEEKKTESMMTAAAVDNEFVVCGDVKGNMWFNQPPQLSSWSNRKQAHSNRISELRLTKTIIVSASYDRTVKLWDRITREQVGMFVCGGPVLSLEVNPRNPTEVICADGEGKLYFLCWKE
ncbi:telomerase protein component 1 isoform X2 [Amphiprion ocellaris]|uniref:telomerase protein component 1 isoform X2 n=1 Tax=Amphiprion ocellaris TaxID=80972 RepID=UPI0024111F64|nr:telomerase protein component 1 isoform X2 [Amphiprion ocellaris]